VVPHPFGKYRFQRCRHLQQAFVEVQRAAILARIGTTSGMTRCSRLDDPHRCRHRCSVVKQRIDESVDRLPIRSGSEREFDGIAKRHGVTPYPIREILLQPLDARCQNGVTDGHDHGASGGERGAPVELRGSEPGAGCEGVDPFAMLPCATSRRL